MRTLTLRLATVLILACALVLPLQASAQDPITVTAFLDFSDDNSLVVPIQITCSNEVIPSALNGYAQDVIPPFPAIFLVSRYNSDGTDTCTVTQNPVPDGYTADQTDCANLALLPDTNISCTLVNNLDPVPEVIPSGIPTLSQYGLALMVLLMLGVGMVGFRRFA